MINFGPKAMGGEIKGWRIFSFLLFYVGTYFVRFTFNDEHYELRVYLDQVEVFKMLLNEGYSSSKLPSSKSFQTGLKITKSSLFIPVSNEKVGLVTIESPHFPTRQHRDFTLYQCEVRLGNN